MFSNDSTIYGNNNYIFSEDFTSTAVSKTELNNHLVLNSWLIDLYRMYMIPFSPKQSISQWT